MTLTRLLFLTGLLSLSLGLVSAVMPVSSLAATPAITPAQTPATTPTAIPWWSFQAIDTMKYSRDAAREFLSNPATADKVIEQQVSQVAQTGATHAGIATPYDDEFLPILTKWVAAARRHHLKVWFRGNWSGWEGWFEYPKITRQEHLEKTRLFLTTHRDLFADGDVFSACPECENGGPGDPRLNGDPTGHTRFLIEEYQLTKAAFQTMNKTVASNYLSMNGDVGRLIMTPETTRAVDGVVTVDHYVRTPEKLVADIIAYAKQSGGQVVLGEMGAPIPDIHGHQNPEQQAAWLDQALGQLAVTPELSGLNYWVGYGGSTRLWNDDGTPRPAVAVLTKYFKPTVLAGQVTNSQGRAISASVKTNHKTVHTEHGSFAIPYLPTEKVALVSAPGHFSQLIDLPATDSAALGQPLVVKLKPLNQNLLQALFSTLIGVGEWVSRLF